MLVVCVNAYIGILNKNKCIYMYRVTANGRLQKHTHARTHSATHLRQNTENAKDRYISMKA